MAGQRVPHHRTHFGLILNEQNRLGSAEDLRRRARALGVDADCSVRGRKILNVVPCPGCAVDEDRPAALLHDAVDGRQPQAGALPALPWS